MDIEYTVSVNRPPSIDFTPSRDITDEYQGTGRVHGSWEESMFELEAEFTVGVTRASTKEHVSSM